MPRGHRRGSYVLRGSPGGRYRRTMPALGLPDTVTACLFDLDGVITQTAKVHAAAWKETFDRYLSAHDMPEFTPHDYDEYVDGKPREAGTRDFLTSRGIATDDELVQRLSGEKNDLVVAKIEAGHVEVYDTSVIYLKAVRAAGRATAVVSSSANCEAVLRSVDLLELFDARVDGTTIKAEGLQGKPDPQTFVVAAQKLGRTVDQAAVYEDAQAGVQAGRAGGFGLVVGVNRTGQADALRDAGADVVVDDLGQLL